MWNLALGTSLFLWLKETVEQHGGCVCVGEGVLAGKGRRQLRLECGECVPLGTEVWWAAEHVLSTRELSPMSIGFEISVILLCGRHMRELQ